LSVTEDALVATCLCTRLGRGETVRTLNVREWTDVVLAVTADGRTTPRALLEKSAAELIAQFGLQPDLAARLEDLLRGLGSVGVEIERLESNGIWVLTRGDGHYPRSWKRKLAASAPPVLFGAGPQTSLSSDLLAIVGSRNVDEAGNAFARQLSELCAGAGWGVVSGGARGVDQISMNAVLSSGGFGVEVLADSLERAVAKKQKREAILGERLTVLTPYLPKGSFTAGKAMGRNRLVYALARYACVVSSDRGRGGTWSGATEAMRKRLAPVFVRANDDVPDGNHALVGEGAVPIRSLIGASIEEVFGAQDQPTVREGRPVHRGGQAEFEF
jgi:predicted Rossmann fold nucleotide-binding protein DprA/Smf involved in DNA uptake